MKNSCFIVLFLLGIIPSAFAQLIGFEEEVPEAFTVSGKGEVKIFFTRRVKVVWNGTFSPVLHWTFKLLLYR